MYGMIGIFLYHGISIEVKYVLADLSYETNFLVIIEL